MSKSKEQQKHFYLRNNDALMNSTKLSMKAKQSILLSKAENTVDAYESDWDDFVGLVYISKGILFSSYTRNNCELHK